MTARHYKNLLPSTQWIFISCRNGRVKRGRCPRQSVHTRNSTWSTVLARNYAHIATRTFTEKKRKRQNLPLSILAPVLNQTIFFVVTVHESELTFFSNVIVKVNVKLYCVTNSSEMMDFIKL